jgi:hypothetical protein
MEELLAANEETRRLKADLERGIRDLLVQFTESTGVRVTCIRLEDFAIHGRTSAYYVETEARL